MKKFRRWLAKNRLIRRYKYLLEVNRILEEYLTERTLEGGSGEFLDAKRKELLQKQAEIRENQSFISFIQKLK